MARDPGIGYRVVATVNRLKGTCAAGHEVGESFEISAHDPAGLCGFCYHHIFPDLCTFQFGGRFPWWEGDKIQLACPDLHNLLTLTLERSVRE